MPINVGEYFNDSRVLEKREYLERTCTSCPKGSRSPPHCSFYFAASIRSPQEVTSQIRTNSSQAQMRFRRS